MVPFGWRRASMSQDFWNPSFDIEHRDDGSILMQQTEALPEHLPTLADYLDKWADAAPDRLVSPLHPCPLPIRLCRKTMQS